MAIDDGIRRLNRGLAQAVRRLRTLDRFAEDLEWMNETGVPELNRLLAEARDVAAQIELGGPDDGSFDEELGL